MLNSIETKNLSYGYEDKKDALSQVSMAVRAGSVTAVLGGNGAGKSTLFLNMNGVYTPSAGELYFEGARVVFDAKGIRKLRKQVGIVFQDPNDQLFSASVRNDIAFGALNMGIDESTVTAMVAQAAEQTGITALLDRPTHALSFGQKKRVAIAGVLIMRPTVIILDEPTAGLDPKGVSEILQLLVRIKGETGLSVVISTHEIDIVPLYCDYAYVLDKGRMVLQGTPRELFAQRGALRAHGLRIPRIAHLMEILKDKDKLSVDNSASTISGARESIKELAARGR